VTSNSIDFELHTAFQGGALNDDEFVDLPALSKEDKFRELYADFIKFLGAISRNEPLCGKNKPSWTDDQGNVIDGTCAYQEGNYWHYHLGPYSDKQAVKAMTYNLSENISGLTSSAVVHYQKINNNSILIVGVSPTHLPFPKSDHPHKNPLFTDDIDE